MNIQLIPITIPRKVFDEIEAMLEDGELKAEPPDISAMIARKMGYIVLSDWILANQEKYRSGYYEGFRPDDIPSDYPPLIPHEHNVMRVAI